MRPSLLVIITALGLAALGATASAGVPSPSNSTVPACLVACPLGDMAFDVVVRDLANNPIASSSVVLDFSSCPQAFLCSVPGPAPDPYDLNLAARTVRVFSNAAGVAHFPVRAGGGCPAGSVRVFADGVLLAQRALASPDQDGDGQVVSVIGNDDPLFAAKLGGSDPTADFDCDGDVDTADQLTFFQHHSHACSGFVDAVQRHSWGRLKAHYR